MGEVRASAGAPSGRVGPGLVHRPGTALPVARLLAVVGHGRGPGFGRPADVAHRRRIKAITMAATATNIRSRENAIALASPARP
jgi:hypothetical protein